MERDEYTDRYVNPYTDFGFKKLFGTEMNKELLISFINSLLSDKEQIRDLTYLNTENLGISEKTVQVHRGSAYRKLDLHNAAEIARLLLRSGDPL